MSDALIVLRRGPGYVAAGTMLLPLRGRAVGGRAGRPRADCLNAVRRWSLPIERAAVRPQQLLLDRSTTVRRRGRECRYRAQWSGGFPMAPHWPTVCRRVLQATREAPVGWRDAALPGLALQEQNLLCARSPRRAPTASDGPLPPAGCRSHRPRAAHSLDARAAATGWKRLLCSPMRTVTRTSCPTSAE
jgi:hypothetical protein